jgi:hypothetical protein
MEETIASVIIAFIAILIINIITDIILLFKIKYKCKICCKHKYRPSVIEYTKLLNNGPNHKQFYCKECFKNIKKGIL